MNKYKVRQIFRSAVESELISIEFDILYLPKALDKYSHNLLKISSLKPAAANILKQSALSKGGDLAVSRGIVNCVKQETNALLSVTDKQLKAVIESIKQQPFDLKQLATELEEFLQTKHCQVKTLQIRNKSFYWGTKTYVMGVLNITPDSFSDGGNYTTVENAINKVKEMVDNGVDIVDIGGESTKPFSQPIDKDTQLKRIIPVIKEIRAQFPALILSVDTRDHVVAQEAINDGVDIINDVSGLSYDENIGKVAAENDVPIILMHSLDTPDKMQMEPIYSHLMDAVCNDLLNSIDLAIKYGVKQDKIIIDPGIGFGKTVNHNIEIIQRISEIVSLDYPVLVGTSRKSFIGALLNLPTEEREEATAATNAYLISQGVDILRIHNVKQHINSIKMLDYITKSKF